MMNLKTGMTEDQILRELRGKVQGENSQDYQLFVQEKFNHIQNEKQLHEVIMSDENYALIVKWNYYRTVSKKLDFVCEYYLCGISDEGNYFVKEIFDFGTRFTVFPQSIKEIVDNINRKNENFERLQGDVLYKIIDFSELVFENENTIIVQEEQETQDKYWRKNIDIKHYDRLSYKTKRTITGKTKIGFKDWDFYEARIFSNHYINTDGLIYATRRNNWRVFDGHDQRMQLLGAEEVFVLRGSFLELKHNEHDKVRIEIPNNKVIHLTPQIHKQNNYD